MTKHSDNKLGSNGHTPGPWHRNIPPASKYNTIFAGRNTHVCSLDRAGKSESEIEANAYLIAAAPDLLAALRLALALFDKGHAIDAFNWGASCLSADNIRELNELPGVLRKVIEAAEGQGGGA